MTLDDLAPQSFQTGSLDILAALGAAGDSQSSINQAYSGSFSTSMMLTMRRLSRSKLLSGRFYNLDPEWFSLGSLYFVLPSLENFNPSCCHQTRSLH